MAAQEIFTRAQVKFGGSFAADKGLLQDALNGLTGVLLQSLQLTYAQTVTRVYEIGMFGQTTNMYYVGGRAQGTMAVGRIIGPALTLKTFYEAYGDICNAGSNIASLNLTAQCGSPTSVTVIYTLKYLVLTQVGLAVTTQDFVINETSQLMFGNMLYDETSVAGAIGGAIAGGVDAVTTLLGDAAAALNQATGDVAALVDPAAVAVGQGIAAAVNSVQAALSAVGALPAGAAPTPAVDAAVAAAVSAVGTAAGTVGALGGTAGSAAATAINDALNFLNQATADLDAGGGPAGPAGPAGPVV